MKIWHVIHVVLLHRLWSFRVAWLHGPSLSAILVSRTRSILWAVSVMRVGAINIWVVIRMTVVNINIRVAVRPVSPILCRSRGYAPWSAREGIAVAPALCSARQREKEDSDCFGDGVIDSLSVTDRNMPDPATNHPSGHAGSDHRSSSACPCSYRRADTI